MNALDAHFTKFSPYSMRVFLRYERQLDGI